MTEGCCQMNEYICKNQRVTTFRDVGTFCARCGPDTVQIDIQTAEIANRLLEKLNISDLRTLIEKQSTILKNAYQDKVVRHRSDDLSEIQLLDGLSKHSLASFLELLLHEAKVTYATCREISLVSATLSTCLMKRKTKIFCFTRPRYLRNDYSDHFFNAMQIDGREVYFDASLHSRVFTEKSATWVSPEEASFFVPYNIDQELLALHRSKYKILTVNLEQN